MAERDLATVVVDSHRNAIPPGARETVTGSPDGAWIATSDDVPGLCCEAATFEELVETVLALAPDLLTANGVA